MNTLDNYTMSLNCFYSLHGVNYKNGFATSCPTQVDPLHILEGKVTSDFWNNENFRNHRKQLQSGKFPAGCHLCKEMEAVNLKSMRFDYSKNFSKEFYNSETGEMDYKALKHIELRFNNSCNMSCLHCDSTFSSSWETKLKGLQSEIEKYRKELSNNLIYQLLGLRHQPKDKERYQRMKLSLDDTRNIINDLCDNFPNLEQFDCSGGEPLKQQQFFLALELLQHHPNAKNLHIFFYTNFNAEFDMDRLNDLLSKFKKVTMNISIDAGTNIYRYFRDGDWNTLSTNLDKFRKINTNSKIVGVITYSIYQIMDIKNVFESILTLPLNDIKAAPVQTPEYINPSLIMHEFRNEVYEDINETKDAIIEYEKYLRKTLVNYKDNYGYLKSKDTFVPIESAIKILDEIKDYIDSTKLDPKWYSSFFVYRRYSDRLFKKRFNDVFQNYQIDDVEDVYLTRIKNG